MSKKITNEVLIAFALGELVEDQHEVVKSYLIDHPKERHLVGLFQHVSKITGSDDSHGASEGAMQQAREIWKQLQKDAPSWLTSIHALIADVIFDSFAQPATVRGASGTRDLEFSSATFEVDVHLERSPIDEDSPWVLSGQIEFHDGQSHQTKISIRRTDTGDEIVTTDVDDHGYFTLKGMPEHLEVLLGVSNQWTYLPGIDFS